MLPTALVGKGTPSVPPEEAVGAYANNSQYRQSQQRLKSLWLRARPYEGKYRSTDLGQGIHLREPTPVVPIPQPQVVMNVPDYLLPIMASAGAGHLSLDQAQNT